MTGSVQMWVAILVLDTSQAGPMRSFDYEPMRLAALALANGPWSWLAPWAFGAFALAFANKAPIFPLHTWLPDTYSEAPIGATVMIAALLSKMGIYGLLRFAIPFFPGLARAAAPCFMVLAIIGVIYGSLVAIKQTDIKRMLAYSSVAHVALIVLGVFAATVAPNYGDVALSGASLQMVNHGLSTGALFLLAGMLYERRGSYAMGDFGGVAGSMPRYTVLFWIALFASIGLPGLNGFIGEYLILQGTMDAGFVYAALGALGVILGAVYMLRMFRDVMFGEARESVRGLRDVSRRETLVLALVSAVMLWIGIAPQAFLRIVNPVSRQALVSRTGGDGQHIG
jgi:NADH-quinone oxidoreductase subunit M